ncbi:hypothetical protein GCM10027355_36220 [Haloplanus salinarum]
MGRGDWDGGWTGDRDDVGSLDRLRTPIDVLLRLRVFVATPPVGEHPVVGLSREWLILGPPEG